MAEASGMASRSLRLFPQSLNEAAQSRFVVVRRQDEVPEYLWGALLCRELIAHQIRVPRYSLVVLENATGGRVVIEAVEGSLQDLERRYRIVPTDQLSDVVRLLLDGENYLNPILRCLTGGDEKGIAVREETLQLRGVAHVG